MSTISRVSNAYRLLAKKAVAHPVKTGGAVLAAGLLSNAAVNQLPLSVPPLNAHQYCLPSSALCLEHVQNFNGAFNRPIEFNTPAMLVSLGSTAVLVGLLVKVKSQMTKLALALIIAGKVDNLSERIPWGRVTDFIKLGAWPDFNVADASITVGCALLLYKALAWIKRNCASITNSF